MKTVFVVVQKGHVVKLSQIKLGSHSLSLVPAVETTLVREQWKVAKLS